MNKTVFLVLPCYNEEEVLEESARRLSKVMLGMMGRSVISDKSRVYFVNDGSKDRTWDIIESICGKDPLFGGISLANNVGHQNAMLAGLLNVGPYCDAAITLDADLQHDINALEQFIQLYYDGNEIVYGVRKARDGGGESLFKRMTGNGFYAFMRLLGVDVMANHADYRLMSSRAIQALSEFKEVNLFLRGIIPMIGFRHAILEYEEHERLAGTSKYTMKRMLGLAANGITSLSIRPLQMIFFAGAVFFSISLMMFTFSVVSFFLHRAVPGWTSIIAPIWLLGGVQLLALGVVGEYIGKIYMESKQRPRFIVDTTINLEKNEGGGG